MSKNPREFRYRLYFWLMDACLVGVAIGFLDALLEAAFDIEYFGLTQTQVLLIGIFVNLFSFLVPLFLLVGKFMRDEYAEQLWRRTVVVLAYVTALVPPALLLTVEIAYQSLGQPDQPPAWLAWWANKPAWGSAIIWVWQSYMLFFVTIFQFLRWRDAR